MSDNADDSHFGRRDYDIELAHLRYQVTGLKEEVTELRSDIKELLEAWKSAKGVSTFVKWAAGIVGSLAIIIAAAKGFKL